MSIPFCPTFQAFRDFDGEGLEVFSFEARDGEDHDLRGIALFESGEFGLKLTSRLLRHHTRVIVHVGGQRGHVEGEPRTRAQAREGRQGEKDEENRLPVSHDYPRTSPWGQLPRLLHALKGSFRVRWRSQELVSEFGKILMLRVEVLNRPVVPDPGDVYAVFRALQLILEVTKPLIGLQGGILLGNHKEPRKGPAELRLGLLEMLDGLGPVQHFLAHLNGAHLWPGPR